MISCSEKALYFGPVMWVFELIKKAYKIDLIDDSKYNIIVGSDSESQVQVSNSFYQDLITNRIFTFSHYFKERPLITLENGTPDYISSIFYLVNGFQEYDLTHSQTDKYGRLDFDHSLQV